MAYSVIGEQKELYQNVTTILNTLIGGYTHTIMQARDDVEDNPLQFPGGWRKEHDKTPYHTAIRELIEEFGMDFSEEFGMYLPFRNPDEQFFVHPKYKNKFMMVLTQFKLPFEDKNALEIARVLNEVKREGAGIEVVPLDESLLGRNLYPCDRIIAEHYIQEDFRHMQTPITMPSLSDFPEEVRKDLEGKVIQF